MSLPWPSLIDESRAALRLLSSELSGREVAALDWILGETLGKRVWWVSFRPRELAEVTAMSDRRAYDHLQGFIARRFLELPAQERTAQDPWTVRPADYHDWPWTPELRAKLPGRIHSVLCGSWCTGAVIEATEALWALARESGLERDEPSTALPERSPYDETWRRWCATVAGLLDRPPREGGTLPTFLRVLQHLRTDPRERQRVHGHFADRLLAVRYEQLYRTTRLIHVVATQRYRDHSRGRFPQEPT